MVSFACSLLFWTSSIVFDFVDDLEALVIHSLFLFPFSFSFPFEKRASERNFLSEILDNYFLWI